MKEYKPVDLVDSTPIDRVFKSITVCFLIFTWIISVVISVYWGFMNDSGNAAEFIQQEAIFGYVNQNLQSSPIKNVIFRDVKCDPTIEEISNLMTYYPDANTATNLTSWYGQYICIQRYQSIRLATTCNTTTEYKCGFYCINQNEGTLCPISSLTIKPNTPPDQNADQNLEQGRDLYISRQTNSYGIFEIQVTVNSYPCLNPTYQVSGGLNFNDSGACDLRLGQDTQSALRVEQASLTSFAGWNGLNNTQASPSAIAYLTERLKIATNVDPECTSVDVNQIYTIEQRQKDVIEIGLTYLILRAVFCCVLVIIFIVEIIVLKGKLVNDVRIVTVLLKINLIILMSLILIESGLVLYQARQKNFVLDYFTADYRTSSTCYTSSQISNIFQQFPDLFAYNTLVYVLLMQICLILVAILEGILLVIYFVQMVYWCCRSDKGMMHHAKQRQERMKQLYTVDNNIGMSQHTDPYLPVVSPKAVPTGRDGQQEPNMFVSSNNRNVNAPQIEMVSQVVLGKKKNSKY